jgi:hypothetical protein
MAKRKTKKEIALETFEMIAPYYFDYYFDYWGDYDEDMRNLRWSIDNEDWRWSSISKSYFYRKWKEYLQAPEK